MDDIRVHMDLQKECHTIASNSPHPDPNQVAICTGQLQLEVKKINQILNIYRQDNKQLSPCLTQDDTILLCRIAFPRLCTPYARQSQKALDMDSGVLKMILKKFKFFSYFHRSPCIHPMSKNCSHCL